MLAAQRFRSAHTPHVVEIGAGALGWLPTFDQATNVPMARTGANGNLLLVSGVPVDVVGDLDHRLTRVAEGDYREAAQSLSQLDGAFAIVFWDSANRKLVVVTDFLGMQPLYTLMLPGGFCLATEIKGAAASGHCPVELDPLGWAMLVCLGHVAEDVTSLRGVHRAPAASVMIYDVATGQWETSTYWRWPDPQPALRLESVDTGEILDRFRRNLLAYEVHHRDAVLLMSGGFDSRLILATLAREGRRPRGLTLLHADEKDDADRRVVVRLARTYGIEYELIQPTPNFYSSAGYIEYVMMSEMATPSFALFVAQLASAIVGRAQAVWEGLAPPFSVSTVHQGRGGFNAFFRSQSQAFDPMTWEALHHIFAREIVLSMKEGFHEFMARSERTFADDEFGVSEFITRNRMRYRTGPNPFKVYANDVAPFTPGLSRELWAITAGIPFEVRDNRALYFQIFRRHFPEQAGVPFCSTRHLYKASGGFNIEYFVLQVRSWLIERLSERYYMAQIARRLGWRALVPGEAHDTIGRTIRAVQIGHPDLNGDGVAALLKDEGKTVDPAKRMARTWLFYWQMWRGVMDGTLRARQVESGSAGVGAA